MAVEWWTGLLGGALIGVAAVALLVLDGRNAGVSGILGGAFGVPGDRAWRWAFLAGLPVGAGGIALFAGGLPQQLSGGWPALVIAGVLVGVGTRVGSGCTSGHGICGLARLRVRSLAATVTFIATGVLTVLALRHVLP